MQVATTLDDVATAEDAGDGLGVGEVLLFEDASGEVVVSVVVMDADGALQDDDAMVDSFVDEVNGAAGDVGTVVEGLLLGAEAGEGGKQRGMDVKDAVGEGLHEGGRDDAQVAGEADDIDAMLVEAGDHLGVVVRAFAPGGGDGEGGEIEIAGGCETWSVFDVGEDYGDLGAGEAVVADGCRDGQEVGASAREKDA